MVQRRRVAHSRTAAKVSRIIKELLPERISCENKRKLPRFAFGGHEGGDSIMGDSVAIWAGGIFKPARVRLIRGKTELFQVVGIIKKPDSPVNFGGNKFKIGQSEW